VRRLARILAWLAVAAATVFLVVQLSFLARVWWWKDHNPQSTAFIQSRMEQLRARDPQAKLRQSWVPYERVATSLKRAVVVAEDAKFADHEGFDWEAIEKAREKNLKKGRIVAGGSTISQQLAKNLFLSGERSALRKGQEALITVMIEHVMDKRRILEIYLNVIEWGEGVFGAEAAARHYYGVAASALAPEQSARLAAMVPNPRFYDRNRNTAFLARHTQTILARMPQAELP
jgi:monofunctional biosynthetic peptidoglycan transglycosylase